LAKKQSREAEAYGTASLMMLSAQRSRRILAAIYASPPRALRLNLEHRIAERRATQPEREFTLSAKAIWCRPISFALAVDPRQSVCGEHVL
jgi:hypothetical protein